MLQGQSRTCPGVCPHCFCRTSKKLLRKRPRYAGVLVRCEGNTFVCHGPAIATDDLSDWHDKPNLAFPVRQPDERPFPVLVRSDVSRLAFGAVRIRRPQIKAQNAIFAFQPKFALYLLIAPDGLCILQFIESHRLLIGVCARNPMILWLSLTFNPLASNHYDCRRAGLRSPARLQFAVVPKNLALLLLVRTTFIIPHPILNHFLVFRIIAICPCSSPSAARSKRKSRFSLLA